MTSLLHSLGLSSDASLESFAKALTLALGVPVRVGGESPARCESAAHGPSQGLDSGPLLADLGHEPPDSWFDEQFNIQAIADRAAAGYPVF